MAAADAKTIEHGPLELQDIYDLLVDQNNKRQILDEEVLSILRNHETRLVKVEEFVKVEKPAPSLPSRPLWALILLVAAGLLIHGGTMCALLWMIWHMMPH